MLKAANEPLTSSLYAGVVVPIPTLPDVSIRMRSELLVYRETGWFDRVPTIATLADPERTFFKLPSPAVTPPRTSSKLVGTVVPIPTPPASATVNLVVPAVCRFNILDTLSIKKSAPLHLIARRYISVNTPTPSLTLRL